MKKKLICYCGLILLCASSSILFADTLEYPTDRWTTKTPSTLNVDQKKIDTLFDLSFQDPATQAVVFIYNFFFFFLK